MKNERQIVVISDLHMGDGGPRDNFAFDHKERDLSRFLDYVEQLNAELFILGDLFEFWQSNIGKVLIQRLGIMDRLGRMQAAYVLGNHDCDFEDLIGTRLFAHPLLERMTGPFERIIAGKRVMFMHGHELDPFSRDGTPRWGRILAILAGILEDRKGHPLLSAGGFTEKSLLTVSRSFMRVWNNSLNLFEKSASDQPPHKLQDSLTPAQDPGQIRGIMALYHLHKRRENYDYLITGHTHAAGFFRDWYCNSGCWIGMRMNFVRIAPDGTISLCEWKNCKESVKAQRSLTAPAGRKPPVHDRPVTGSCL
ncbi:MAG: UDP-2,3-diacylglucosamine diphosphatase [Planctomycetaceae bacterium]|nr:UDP-2,3-diacylglucosamine diphosphatase [Planctomycetaceae bacterium]